MSRKSMVAPLLVLAGLAAGCSQDVDSICRALAEECGGPVEDCRIAGASFETQAVETGCEAPLDDYLDCIDDAQCGWRRECVHSRDALDVCTAGAE